MHSPATQAPDAHLLGLYVSERSEEAFAELVRRHQPLVRGAACRLTGGSVQAAEAIKVIAGMGEPLVGRLLSVDALRMQWHTIRFRRDPDCPACARRGPAAAASPGG